jgi:hypothetical protein
MASGDSTLVVYGPLCSLIASSGSVASAVAVVIDGETHILWVSKKQDDEELYRRAVSEAQDLGRYRSINEAIFARLRGPFLR